MKEGQCLHLVNNFICTEGKHQNYPCPYRDNISKCPCSIAVTKEMVEQWENRGVCVFYQRRSENDDVF